MKITRISALLAAALVAVTAMTACGSKKEKNKTGADVGYSKPIDAYKENPEIGKEKIEVSMNEDTSHNNSTFKLNSVIDSGKRLETGEKYIYLDVTIKNSMDEAYEVNALNNFYLILDNGDEVFTDIRTDIYAKQYLNGYEQLLEIPANGEYNGYVGFLVPATENTFTACYFATANENDKKTVIRCPVAAADIQSPPEGLFKPETN